MRLRKYKIKNNFDPGDVEMNVPEDLKYTSDHEWILIEDDIATIGRSPLW